jgi:hypothetical protein
MTATLTVELDAGPIERTGADVIVVFFFDSDRPLRGGAGRADWRLCGQLSRLILSGKLTGAPGEAVLMPTGGGLAAPLLIALGLGSRNTFDLEACEALGREAARRAQRLGARTVALPLPDPQAGDLELRERVDALVTGAVRALAELSVDLRLRLVPPLAEVARAQKAVAKLASKHRPASVTLRLAGKAVPRSAGSPQGGEGSSTGRPQLIK